MSEESIAKNILGSNLFDLEGVWIKKEMYDQISNPLGLQKWNEKLQNTFKINHTIGNNIFSIHVKEKPKLIKKIPMSKDYIDSENRVWRIETRVNSGLSYCYLYTIISIKE